MLNRSSKNQKTNTETRATIKTRTIHIIYSFIILVSLGLVYNQASINQQTKDLNQQLNERTKGLI